jgi:hypothetical protein
VNMFVGGGGSGLGYALVRWASRFEDVLVCGSTACTDGPGLCAFLLSAFCFLASLLYGEARSYR